MPDRLAAVFLSYASQDAEAARRIAESLRAAGVEVWFDVEGGLEHGDEWDAKIRRQIKECVLFLPLISANTQAREEGYFRIEWDLAAERARGIASGVAFILPVVIDDTKEPLALVPDRFRSVQWTRLPGGVVPADVLQRFLKLWSHRAGVVKQHQSKEHGAGSMEPIDVAQGGQGNGGAALRRDGLEESRHKAPPTSTRWLAPAIGIGAVIVSVAIWFWLRPASGLPTPVSPAPAVTTPPVSPARELVAKARGLALALDATREDFALAEEYCQRALKLDPDDAEVWAIYSQVHSAFGYRGWDTSPERREQTRTTAERAMRLAPQSAHARLAQAGAWAAFGINRDDREKLLREIVRDDPSNQEALRFLAVTVLPKPGGLEEALALNERSAALPGGDPLALFNNARYLWTAGQPANGYEVVQRALAQRKFTSALVLKMSMELTWRGDLAAAEETLKQLPPATLQEDRANYSAGLLRYYQRDAAGALEVWGAFPRDFYMDFVFDGPKGLLLGLADELDHRDVAARTEWRTALREVEKKIAAAPNRASPYYSQAYLLACLGEKAAASEALRTHEQLAQIKYLPGQGMVLALAKVYARLGRFDEIFAHSPPGNLAVFRISPDFDALRADPRFERWVAVQPNAKPAMDSKSPAHDPGPSSPSPVKSSFAKASEDGSSTSFAPEPKSVAVLAFANLSDDKANEYFSDGISEELLNVLAKVPGLKVTARTSSFHFKGKDTPIPEIARQLGVAYVVEGSVRKSGDKVRITAQLIKAADGFHVWSDTFTRDLKDVFAVQDEIAGLIAQNLRLTMGAISPGAKTAINPEAFDLYVQARQAWNFRTPEGFDRAEELLNRALALEPEFARAHAALSDVWVVRGMTLGEIGQFGQRESPVMRRIITSAERAVALDPNSAEAHASLGSAYTSAWRLPDATRTLRHAVALNPNYATGRQNLGRALLAQGFFAEGAAELARAAELDPLSHRIIDNNAIALLAMGRPAGALAAAERALALMPESVQAAIWRARSLSSLGRHEEAVGQARRVNDEGGPQAAYFVEVFNAAGLKSEAEGILAREERKFPAWKFIGLVALGRHDEAMAAMNPADMIPQFFYEVNLDPVRDDPRFKQLLATVGLTEANARIQAWRKAHPLEKPESRK